MDSKFIFDEFNQKEVHLKQVMEAAKFLLGKGMTGIKYHSIDNRIKSFDSFKDKIRRKKTVNPFDDIHDIVGLRVVCLFLDDIKKICEIIEGDLEVINKKNIIEDHEPHLFGYMGVRYKVKFKSNTTILEKNEMRDMVFEVQVRTIAQDAWASISHHLDYKKDNGIPDDLKRDFYALSGLFYVADTHFKFIKESKINLTDKYKQ